MREIGQTEMYPSQFLWRWIATLPEEVAIAWANAIAPTAVLGPTNEHTAAHMHDKWKGCEWGSGYAVLVDRHHDHDLCIMRHGSEYWLMRRNTR